MKIGDTVADNTGCPGSFTSATSNTFTQACLMPLTYSATGILVMIASNCKPNNGVACTGPQILPCPITQVFPVTGFPNQLTTPGNISQTCTGGIYYTVNNSCASTTCNGQPVGTYRTNKTKACPLGTVGTMLEVCTTDGQWTASTANCTPVMCVGGTDTASNVFWADTFPGTWAYTGDVRGSNCNSGSPVPISPANSIQPLQVVRYCNPDGTWSDALGVCGCADDGNSNITWLPTAVGNTASTATGSTCIYGSPSSYPTPITRLCNAGGWAAVAPGGALCQ